MKIDWRGETAAALVAFALTGVAMWGSIIPVQAVPILPGHDRSQIALVQSGAFATAAHREGDDA